MVLDAVNEMHRHVTADQIYTFIKEKYPSIGRGTVYRNLGILVEEGKVRKVEVPDGSDRFDFTLENHYLSLIHISEPTRLLCASRMPSSA